jgi:P-type Mg2+ transporter
VIFVIRTAGNPVRSRPSNAPLLSVCGECCSDCSLLSHLFGASLGFAPLPTLLFGVLALFIVTYLWIVQLLKRGFYAEPHVMQAGSISPAAKLSREPFAEE